ncbi:MAG: c-type cytochrome [Candidatus Kuenenia stuttgartiensis]|nr:MULTISPECIES: c-type cytochrome [Kuenenia]MBE7547246.1 c-type cytochrome [Planctomycetia bacterium]MBW7941755.1 c-type cytochrome [Candidatus Kuenenia stuttgartiensis]MBZ0191100.1 c-type cytochrome [Candidatus Kuenenia stuttgartiensis]MCL4727293.1 c-type cytochrome [Candidatus Kuenenia stuttgartiensis]MCZ7621229.1 c-type cytochrome [Candidatus Kuenenia sp.]
MGLMAIKTAIIAFILIVPMSVHAEDVQTAKKIPEKYLAIKNPYAGSSKLVALERGRSVYSRKCAKCHGENGDGVGGILEGFALPVFNKEFFSQKEDGYIFWLIEQGLSGTLMPSFGPDSGDNLSADDIWKAIIFVRERFGK